MTDNENRTIPEVHYCPEHESDVGSELVELSSIQDHFDSVAERLGQWLNIARFERGVAI